MLATPLVAVGDQQKKKEVVASIERHSAELVRLSWQIWEFEETALREKRSAAVPADYAEAQGFRVTVGESVSYPSDADAEEIAGDLRRRVVEL